MQNNSATLLLYVKEYFTKQKFKISFDSTANAEFLNVTKLQVSETGFGIANSAKFKQNSFLTKLSDCFIDLLL